MQGSRISLSCQSLSNNMRNLKHHILALWGDREAMLMPIGARTYIQRSKLASGCRNSGSFGWLQRVKQLASNSTRFLTLYCFRQIAPYPWREACRWEPTKNPKFKYTSIQINRSLRSFMHVNKHNVGPSRIIGGTVWTEWQAQSTALSHIQLRSGAEKRDKRHMYRHNATTNTKTAKEIKNLYVKMSFEICSKHLLKSLISNSRLTSPVS